MNIFMIVLIALIIVGNVVVQPEKNEDTFSAVSKSYVENYGEPLNISKENSAQLGYSTVCYYWKDKYVVFYRNRYKSSAWIVLEEKP